MKLRIKGDSLRLRISPSEMSRLLDSGHIEETIRFGPEHDAIFSYALSTKVGHLALGAVMDVQYVAHKVLVALDDTHARAWAQGPEVGLYASVNTGRGQLEVAVEKDFACLDKSDSENQDTYPHPQEGKLC